MPEDFNEVVLTEEAIDELIYQERLRIYFDAKSIQKRNAEANAALAIKKPFTYDELKEYVLCNNPNFKLDTFSEPIFNLLCLYFSRDKRFEDLGEGFSLYKGLAIVGVPGCGKTEVLRLFQKNKRQSFLLTSINNVNEQCKENGIEKYKLFTAEVPGWGNNKNYFYNPHVCWAIDDVGLEEPVNDYGNKAFVFSKIIQEKYSNKHLMQYYPLHITTMLIPDQLHDKYGGFISSRFKEMFNYINYKGGDRR